jgi:hypothetical protein
MVTPQQEMEQVLQQELELESQLGLMGWTRRYS